MIVHELEKLVQGAVQSLKAEGLLSLTKETLVLFEHPENLEHGDYSTNDVSFSKCFNHAN